MAKVEFIPYAPEHMLAFSPGKYSEAQAASVVHPGLSYTCKVDGFVAGMAGIIPQWPGRAIAWTLVGGIPTRAWPAVTRKTIEVLEEAHRQGYWRIEMTTRCDCPAAYRWAIHLGFRTFAALPMYGPDGSDHYGFVRFGTGENPLAALGAPVGPGGTA